VGTEFVYRSHFREILDRVAEGVDTRPGTAAEVCCLCREISLVAPLRSSAIGLYLRMWAAAFPDKPDDADRGRHYEALRRSSIDELEALARRKLTVPERTLGLEAGSGPIVNPFLLDRSRRAGRANAHHNPLDPFKPERQGRYRPKTPGRVPRRMPDDQFNQLFAGLRYHRDRALLAFWVSTGARAEELLTVLQHQAEPGEQLLTVTRKGSRLAQALPASPDAFVWLRLYQEELWRKGAPRGRNDSLWLTVRRPWRPLAYLAARAMFSRAQHLLGSKWTLHGMPSLSHFVGRDIQD
jgi:hypothetical protein